MRDEGGRHIKGAENNVTREEQRKKKEKKFEMKKRDEDGRRNGQGSWRIL